eukprot:TRINITY_DN31645_c0_g1_i1.p3 TRINITY_DN31645_c0_g1~~TRINITY_DN31645_c0_g1_i1.p3  ORF type:complete len:103 (+),score=2.46 TRINITY_DN31645_c0_g1_i1:206-514(+)
MVRTLQRTWCQKTQRFFPLKNSTRCNDNHTFKQHLETYAFVSKNYQQLFRLIAKVGVVGLFVKLLTNVIYRLQNFHVIRRLFSADHVAKWRLGASLLDSTLE